MVQDGEGERIGLCDTWQGRVMCNRGASDTKNKGGDNNRIIRIDRLLLLLDRGNSL